MRVAAIQQVANQPRDQALAPAMRSHLRVLGEVPGFVQPPVGQGYFRLSKPKDQHGNVSGYPTRICCAAVANGQSLLCAGEVFVRLTDDVAFAEGFDIDGLGKLCLVREHALGGIELLLDLRDQALALGKLAVVDLDRLCVGEDLAGRVAAGDDQRRRSLPIRGRVDRRRRVSRRV